MGDVLEFPPGNTCNVYHLVNPRATTWQELLPVVLESAPQSCTVVSFNEWVDALLDVPDTCMTAKDVTKNPAVKLAAFFLSLKERSLANNSQYPQLDVADTRRKSRVLDNVHGVSQAWMRLWIQQWNSN